VFLTFVIGYLRSEKIVDLTISSTPHSFLAVMLAYFIVTRAAIITNRFMEARTHLESLIRSATEIVHMACVLSKYNRIETAVAWRRHVARKTIVLMRVAIVALEHQSSDEDAWDLTELIYHDRDVIETLRRRAGNTDGDESGDDDGRVNGSKSNRGSCIPRFDCVKKSTIRDAEENFRAPIQFALDLRQLVLSPRSGGILEKKFHICDEVMIFMGIEAFMTAFFNLRKLVVASFPFPKVQMGRTLLFIWVFTLPLCLVGVYENRVMMLVITFLMTYGFLGLEYVSMELDDPFGNDPNDFDDLKMAQMAFEDIYMTLYQIDGVESADRVRAAVLGRKETDAFELFKLEHQKMRSVPSAESENQYFP